MRSSPRRARPSPGSRPGPAWWSGTATTRTSGATSSGAGGQQLAGRSWGNGYYTELLPAIVAELDPRTPYSPGSPFSYADYHHPNDPRSGTMHIWDVWNQLDYTHYRDYPARFVSEFGFQGPAAWSTLFSVVHDQPADPYGTQMLVHQKAHEGNLKLERGLGDHLPAWGTRRRRRHGRLALADLAQPGPRGRVRDRALPQPLPPQHRLDRLAAERQLAGRLLGGRRPRRHPQAAVARPEAGVRGPAAHLPAPHGRVRRRGAGADRAQRLPGRLGRRARDHPVRDGSRYAGAGRATAAAAPGRPVGDHRRPGHRCGDGRRRDRRVPDGDGRRRHAGHGVRLLRRGHRPAARRTRRGVRGGRAPGRGWLSGPAGGERPGQGRGPVPGSAGRRGPGRHGPDHAAGRRRPHLRGDRVRAGRGRADRPGRCCAA